MVTQMVRMTESEISDFKQVMERNYGACECKAPWPKRTCAGHMFLEESDRHVSRIDRLLFVRRTVQTWIDEELTGKCKVCSVDERHEMGADRCMDCQARERILAATESPSQLP